MSNKPRKSVGSALLAPPKLPPLPSTPPPLPEGAVEGFPDAPEGASAAAPITETLAPSGGTAVDPVTGEKAADLGTSRGGKDPALQAELEAAADKLAEARRLEDLAVARGELHRPVAVSPGRPVSELPIEDHKAAQAAYRERMRTLTHTTDADLEEALAAPEVDLVTETKAERAQREREEAFDRYTERVEAMDPSEPRYVATGRAPRPKVEGYVLAPGDIVPGAAYFVRLQSWLDGGIIRKL